jgi:hypothetical protein
MRNTVVRSRENFSDEGGVIESGDQWVGQRKARYYNSNNDSKTKLRQALKNMVNQEKKHGTVLKKTVHLKLEAKLKENWNVERSRYHGGDLRVRRSVQWRISRSCD